MNKKEIIQAVKIIVLGLVLSVGASYVFSAPNNQPNLPPSANVTGPLNVGPSAQDKVGSLHITSGGFRSWGPALFDDTIVIGGTTPFFSSKLTVMGDTSIIGNELVAGNLVVNALNGNGVKQICVNNSGQIIYCTGGSCGISNGASFSSIPTSNLCTVGVASTITGNGPWNWTCTDNGVPVNCTASRGACQGTYVQTYGICDTFQVPVQPDWGQCGNTQATCGGVYGGFHGCVWDPTGGSTVKQCSTLTTQGQCVPSGCSWNII